MKDTDFWSNKAEAIKTAGVWSELNKQIELLASDSKKREEHFEGKDNEWLLEVFASLCAQAFEEYQHLRRIKTNNQKFALSEISWRARNLLELSIWSGYCSTNTDNARRFYEDAGLDMLDLAKNFINWGQPTKQDEEWILNFSNADKDLKDKMSLKGMNNIDRNYTRVSDAAKKIGNGQNFNLANKMLSKFAHPTAAFILRPSPDFFQKLEESFFEEACMYFCATIDIMSIWLLPEQK